MKSILITGCNRGIGLGLVKILARKSNPPKWLISTCRDLRKAEDLKAVAEQHNFVHLLELDVRNGNSYDKFTKNVADIVKDEGLNVLFNNAGVSPKFTRLNLVKTDQITETFEVNTVAPIMLTKALLPLLKQAAQVNSAKPMGTERSAVVNMSSYLGSIEMNDNGGLYPYRCSKVALNMATKTMSIDLKNDGIIAVCIHPGWVKTDMGGQKAPMEIEKSTSSIVDLLYRLGEEHNGNFYQYDGTKLPW